MMMFFGTRLWAGMNRQRSRSFVRDGRDGGVAGRVSHVLGGCIGPLPRKPLDYYWVWTFPLEKPPVEEWAGSPA